MIKNFFAVKIKKIADISNKRKRNRTSSISTNFFIKLIEFVVCNHRKIAADF